MNKSIKVHLVWGTVAIAAFLTGYFVLPSDPDEGPAFIPRHSGGRGTEDRAADPDSRGAETALQGEDAGDAAEKIGKDEVARMLAEKVALTKWNIVELGEQFRTSSDPVAKRLAFSKLLQGLTAENALLVREQIEGQDHRSAEFQEFHYAWGAVAGLEAIMFGIDTEEDDMKPALAGWAGTSPAEAMAWIEGLDMENDSRFDPLLKDRKLEANGLRHHLLSGIVEGLADTDTRQAAEFVERMVASGQAHPGQMHIVTGEVLRAADRAPDASAWAESLPEGRVYDAFSLDVSGRPGGVWAAGVQLAHQDNLYGSDATSRRARLPAKQQIGDDLIATPAATWVFPMEGYFLIGLIVWTDIQSDPHALVQEVAPWSGLPCEEVRSEARKLKITDFHGSLPAESP